MVLKKFLDVTIIPLKKKQQAEKYSNQRTISLISHQGRNCGMCTQQKMRTNDTRIGDQLGFKKQRRMPYYYREGSSIKIGKCLFALVTGKRCSIG